MRILVSLVRFEPEKTLGSEIFLQSFLESLPMVLGNEKVAFAASEKTCAWGENIAKELVWIPQKLPASNFGRMFFESVNIETIARRWQADVIYFPFNIMPKVKMPSVLLLHDLVGEFYCRKFPFYRPFYFRYIRKLVRRSIKNSDAVITISNTVAAELKNARFFEKRIKIYVAPLAVNRNNIKQRKPKLLADNDKKIILQPGAQLPHKSHITGIKAMVEIRKQRPDEFSQIKLVLTGGANTDKNLNDFIKKNDISDSVTFLGRLDTEELEWTMQNCEVVCFPTLYEGFGLGLVEAQARRIPIIASDISVNREISNDAAVFFEPENEQDLACKIIETVFEGNNKIQYLLDEGLQKVNKRYWINHCAEVIETLKLTANL